MARTRFFDPASVKVAMRTGNIWIQMLPWAYLIVIALFVCLGFAIFYPVVKRNHELQIKKVVTETKINDANALSIQLHQRNHSLQTDRVYIERIARDILNVGRPGEVIFQFPEYKSSQNRKSIAKKDSDNSF